MVHGFEVACRPLIQSIKYYIKKAFKVALQYIFNNFIQFRHLKHNFILKKDKKNFYFQKPGRKLLNLKKIQKIFGTLDQFCTPVYKSSKIFYILSNFSGIKIQ